MKNKNIDKSEDRGQGNTLPKNMALQQRKHSNIISLTQGINHCRLYITLKIWTLELIKNFNIFKYILGDISGKICCNLSYMDNYFLLSKIIILDFEKQNSLHFILQSIRCYNIYFTNRSVIEIEILAIEVTRCHERKNVLKNTLALILYVYRYIAILSIICHLNMICKKSLKKIIGHISPTSRRISTNFSGKIIHDVYESTWQNCIPWFCSLTTKA